MTKRIFSICACALFAFASANAQVAVKKKDASATIMTGNVYFKQNGQEDSWSLSSDKNGSYNDALNIKNYQGLLPAPEGSVNYQWATFVAPTHPDNYTSIAGWDQRSQWNLSNIHDPSVMLAEDGYYYMYCTDAGYGNPHLADVKGNKHGHFQCRRSKDLVNWEYMGGTMYGVPSWVQPKLNEIRKAMGLDNSTANFSDDLQFGYWAPCARKVRNGLYRMYYCIVCPGYLDPTRTSWSERAFIGMMETTDPSDLTKWEDKGYVVTNYSDRDLSKIYVSPTDWQNCYYKYNAIDPSYIITPEGEHWLIYGSWHSGFAAVELDPATGKTKAEQGNPWGAENEAAYGKRIFTRKMGDRWQGSEAPEVVYHDGYYYLFLAYDALDVPYNTRVVRSKNIDGPYYSINGVNVSDNGGEAYPIMTHPYKFNNDHGWVGISHCAVFDDGEGNWYYCSQQRYPADYPGVWASNAVMLGGVRSIRWTEDGWPVVMPERYAAVPQAEIEDEDLYGEWEHIDLGYQYGVMQTSQKMILGSDHKVTEGWNAGADWSFDPTNNVLDVGGLKLYLQREVNWEAAPRKTTIVYAGMNTYRSGSTCKTYWGKKVAGLQDEGTGGSEDENVTVVGATDFSSPFWADFSDYYKLAPGKTLHMKFKNHSSKKENWSNWVLAVTNNANRGASAYKEYFVLRADSYAWWPTGNTIENPDAGFTLSNDYNWDTFRDDMDGATVEMTIQRDGTKVIVTAVSTTTAGKTYTETFSMPDCGTATATIRAFLTCENSWMEIYTSDTYIE